VALIGINSAGATDYQQCRGMKSALADLWVYGVRKEEERFREFHNEVVRENCKYEEFANCSRKWWASSFPMLGRDWQGNAIYSPLSKPLLTRIKKIEADRSKEGCP